MPILVNVVGFCLLWLILVLGAFHAQVLPTLVLLGGWTALHLYYSPQRRLDLRILLLALCLGPINDLLLMHGDLLDFVGGRLHADLPPIWIPAHWVNFALLLNHGLRDFHHHPWRLALLGACAAPLAYLAGASLGVVRFEAPLPQALPLLSFGWAITLPLLMLLGGQTDHAQDRHDR